VLQKVLLLLLLYHQLLELDRGRHRPAARFAKA